ncbi:MAG: hypothetical protein KGJ60_02030 [Verrucomicrobiota bacterium]|nr:hypothetical protein [Verrucomicrobiota bacterium]
MKKLILFSLLAFCRLVVSSQTTNIAYTFTNASSNTLSDVYIIDTEPAEAYAFIAPVSTNGQTFGAGSQIAGLIRGTTYGTNYLTLLAVFANGNTTNVAVSLPLSLATNLIPNGSWNSFNNSTNFPFGLLPDESTTRSDLQTDSVNTLGYNLVYNSFNYLPDSDPVLQPTGVPSVIVAFDGAQDIGSFSFGFQPALSVTSGNGGVTIRWPANASGFTLAQSTNLASGVWSNVTNVPTIVGNNNSLTLPIGTTSHFFELHEP